MPQCRPLNLSGFFPCVFSQSGQKINEQKLQAFAIGTMGKRPLSKKEQEDRRKREEETAAAHVNVDLVAGGGLKKMHVFNVGMFVGVQRVCRDLSRGSVHRF